MLVVAWWVRCRGGLGLLVRCCRESCPAGALLQEVLPCWCAAAGSVAVLVRCRRGHVLAGALSRLALGVVSERASTGRLAGSVGLGTRAAGRVGPKDLRSCAGGSRMLRLPRDPVTNAEAFKSQRTKEESWVHWGVGWAALLPSRGTVHEKGEALPPLTRSAVDLPPVQRSEGGRSTDGPRRFLRPTRATAREPEPPPLPAARSRPSRRPGRVEAAPTQPHLESKPPQRSHTRERSHTDSPAGRRKPHPHQGETA